MQLLENKSIIADQFQVILLIKQGSYAQTYRVKGSDGRLYFLKLFNLSQIHPSSIDTNGNLIEIQILKVIAHSRIVKYVNSGEIVLNSQKYQYLVTEFLPGETLFEKLVREQTLSGYDVREYTVSVLEALHYLHTLENPIIHNEITVHNVMLDLSKGTGEVKIIDFGYARYFHNSSKSYNREGLSPYYLAPECFNNISSPQTDVFSTGAFMYHLMFGIPPWSDNGLELPSVLDGIKETMYEVRKQPLRLPIKDTFEIETEKNLLAVMKKAISLNSEQRFTDANEMLLTLKGMIPLPEIKEETAKSRAGQAKNRRKSSTNSNRGFARIAGMKELKDKLQNAVIDLLKDDVGASTYGLSIPNGMLLYGPPGCGKTFFAECFAEEAGFNYKYIRSSDIASIYVHGSQEKIGNLFREARENTPIILCFDELDAFVPDRGHVNTASQSGEVNEFLTQLNNCGDEGIFVIGTTNREELIDPAILRAGRMDIKIFVPPPDFEARKALFTLYLQDRPLDFGIDYDKLAHLTENYAASDIKLIVDEASRREFKVKGRISMADLELSVNNTISSLGTAKAKPQFGFKLNNKKED